MQKQIQPTLGLDTFVEKGFKTKSDLIERRNFIIALAGVFVAIVTSGASLIMSLLDNGNTEELNKINNSLQEIRQELDLPEESTQQYKENPLTFKKESLGIFQIVTIGYLPLTSSLILLW